ncbi:MAG: hypothetical protein PUB07_01900 [Clostridia bacterium]|nr:hypothetical protein [Clostridia bacterium]
MKQHLSYVLKLLGNRMFFNLVTVCLIPVFIAIIDNMGFFGHFLFAFVICSVYLAVVFDMIWKLGRHDRQPYATEKIYPLKGLVIGLLSEVPYLIMFCILLLSNGSVHLRAVYRCLCIAPFMSLVPEDAVTPGYALVLFIVPMLCLIAYPVGLKKPSPDSTNSLAHKIMFKKENR